MRFALVFAGLAGLLIWLLYGCVQDAPHDNVFDPESNLFEQSAGLQGQVLGKYLPYAPLADIKVELVHEQRFTITDEQGNYAFDQLRPGSLILEFSGSGFITVRDTLTVAAGVLTEYSRSLNGIPEIAAAILKTRHISHWQPTADEYVLDVVTQVSDPDGSLDIDSVKLMIPGWDYATTLTVGASAADYTAVLFDDVFGDVAFPEIQGELITLQCRDQSAVWGPSYATQVSRLIVSVPQALSPASLATVDSLPTFRWSDFDAGFVVNYQVNIFRLDESGIPLLTLFSPVLADSTLRWDASTALASARYYWTLTVIDRYANISVSREASFIVESP